ncbi:hsp70-like protein [Kwoniella heveanensis BCC8398]|uniref:Hsp70-like protein n=1 Tax=Kwoniella heveanensis BCC8398 TaxID=1296120 RepID=A0A1B9GR90_9TREE|nr:hsp70-like protein [Kwoniella heveanensis BCC8398]
MPDLNELLRWSIANSTYSNANANVNANGQDEQAQPEATSSTSDGLTLRYTPPSAAAGGSGASQQRVHAGTATLHPSDSAPADLSPASTPGPGTPTGLTNSIPLPEGVAGPGKRDDLTTEMLDLILGKSDSITMKEKMATATDESVAVEERVEALDDFEMLIELIDNANNMPILKLWQPLLGLLSSPHPEIVAHTCWIIGTAVQNNLKAQAALYINEAFPQILSTLTTCSHPSSVRAKATYALSSALKHWPLAAPVLSTPYSLSSSSSSAAVKSERSGYSVLKEAVNDGDKVVRRKTAFLVGTLVMQSGEKYQGEIPNEVRGLLEERMKEVQQSGQASEGLLEGLKREGVFAALLDGLKGTQAQTEGGEVDVDVEYEENALRALVKAVSKGGLDSAEKEQLKDIWNGWSFEQKEERGFVGEEGKEIEAGLA